MLRDALLILGGLAGALLVLLLIGRTIYVLAVHHLHKRGICDFCHRAPATLAWPKADVIGCEPCMRLKTGAPLEFALKRGHVVPFQPRVE